MELTKPLNVDMVKFKKEKSLNPAGRPRGAKNKIPTSLAAQILEIAAHLDEIGKGLKHCAEKDPRWFFENFVKPMIPKNFSLDGTNPAKPVSIKISWIKPGENV